MKYCRKCESHKGLADFAVDKRSKDGRKTYCKTCCRAAMAEYYVRNKAKVDARNKSWREKNPEAARQAERAWREKNPEAARQTSRDWYAKQRERILATKRAWYEVNKERSLATANSWREKNPDRVSATSRLWRIFNQPKVLATKAKRRSAKLLRTPKWLTTEDFKTIELIYGQAQALEASTGVPHHVDHIYPLQGRYVSGLHVPANLQVLTASENCSKSNRWAPQ